MRTLTGQSIPNIISTDGDYPYGRAQDETIPGAGDGTPITEKVGGGGMADIYQAVIEQMRLAGIIPNEAPEKKEASQIVEAFGWFAPVAVIKCGATLDNATYRVLGGKYQKGYTAEIEYGSFVANGKVALYKLTIKKDGAVSATEKYLVNVVTGAGGFPIAGTSGTSATAVAVSASHDFTDGSNWAFYNDTASNINVAAGDLSDADADDLKTWGMIITVHRVV